MLAIPETTTDTDLDYYYKASLSYLEGASQNPTNAQRQAFVQAVVIIMTKSYPTGYIFLRARVAEALLSPKNHDLAIILFKLIDKDGPIFGSLRKFSKLSTGLWLADYCPCKYRREDLKDIETIYALINI